ncbi:MAG: molybdenum cofactor guanylyltransferase [Cyanobacteria bacterium P01_D01_bin.1]
MNCSKSEPIPPAAHSATHSVAHSLSVMVLAGGQSRRMGKDKALLPMENGQPLLLKTVQAAQSLSTNIVVVTPWPERYQPLLPEFVALVKDPLPSALSSSATLSAGPLSGFAHGWGAISSDWCLLLACDMPYLDFSHLQQWWLWLNAKLDNPSTGLPTPMASLVPGKKSSKSGWEPLCGYYHRSGIPSLTQHLESGQHSFQSWLSKIPVAPYYSIPERVLFNCNTPGDWNVVCDRITK